MRLIFLKLINFQIFKQGPKFDESAIVHDYGKFYDEIIKFQLKNLGLVTQQEQDG